MSRKRFREEGLVETILGGGRIIENRSVGSKKSNARLGIERSDDVSFRLRVS